MSMLDIIITAVLGLSALRGFRKGIISQAISIVALLVGIWATIHLSDAVAGQLVRHFDFAAEHTWAWAFLTTFALAVALVFLAGRFAASLLESASLGIVNRLLGLAFGFAKGLLMVSSVLVALTFAGVISKNQEGKSRLVGPVRSITPKVFPSIRSYALSAVEQLRRDAPED